MSCNHTFPFARIERLRQILQAAKAVQEDTVNYNRLCQQEFGIGAEYDGEMCTCRAGYVNRNGRCARVSY